MEITPDQCRAARALVNWSQDRLATEAKVAKKTIADFEREVRQPYPRTVAALRAALEAASVVFIAENGGGAGVRLRKPPSATDTATPPAFAETIAVALDALPAKAVGNAEAQDGAPGAGPKDD